MFMLPLVQAYCCGEINDKKELKEKQYQRMADLKLSRSRFGRTLAKKTTGNKRGCREKASGSEEPLSHDHTNEAFEGNDNRNNR